MGKKVLWTPGSNESLAPARIVAKFDAKGIPHRMLPKFEATIWTRNCESLGIGIHSRPDPKPPLLIVTDMEEDEVLGARFYDDEENLDFVVSLASR